MEVRQPKWTLRRLCPVCGQGSALVLVACPGCAWIAVQCAEEGSTFDDARGLRVRNGDARCPRCDAHALADFEVATDAQLEREGLTAEDYA